MNNSEGGNIHMPIATSQRGAARGGRGKKANVGAMVSPLASYINDKRFIVKSMHTTLRLS